MTASRSPWRTMAIRPGCPHATSDDSDLVGPESPPQPVPGVAYLSTPVITTPRMNARWARRKTTTGTIMAINAEAWMSVGCVA